MGNLRNRLLLTIAVAAVAACSGSGNSGDPVGTAPPPPSAPECTGSCVTATSFLSVAEVQRVIAQASAEAAALNRPATIAVVDRVGNVLAVFRMNGAPPTVTITSDRGVTGGLENLTVPSELAAIAKAVTGAFLSSEGNAFSTRTANQIVQENFNPGEGGQPSGPLFGVQFSQLPCSDLNTRLSDGMHGPKRSPLGLSADPGGFPLYKDGTPVGGIGVAADGVYGLDLEIADLDRDFDELIALAGTFGFAAPLDRRGDRITVEGKTFRFSDAAFDDLASNPSSPPAFATLAGELRHVPAYFDGAILSGVAFGQPASGIRPDTLDYAGLDAFVLVDQNNVERYRPRAGTDGANALTENEVRTLMREALAVANRARAQIRRPLGTQARVSVSIVDTNGEVLALARTRDAPVFGIDVSLQKARTAMFYSSAAAADGLLGLAPAEYFSITLAEDRATLSVIGETTITSYVQRTRDFLGMPTALADGAIAFSDRAGGNLSRPFFPDGIAGTNPGPFSRPFNNWSPFHVGLQLDLVYNQVALHLAHVLNQSGLPLFLDDTLLVGAPRPEFPMPLPDQVPGSCTLLPQLGNGIQIFPGSVPIYRGGTLVGGIGVSGDGIDQDDMVSFLGLH
ncbi:MAG TPA: heme-binding protein, partial [Xanthomonadaceae bacterium]|nr:heme-binding protein [Xanthomonadaceae bacterium]